jgi:hypothetical protein
MRARDIKPERPHRSFLNQELNLFVHTLSIRLFALFSLILGFVISAFAQSQAFPDLKVSQFFMWSYIQYSRIGRQVEGEYSSRIGRWNQRTDNQSIGENECDGEPSLLELSRSQTLQNEAGSRAQLREQYQFQVALIGEDDPLDPRNWPLAARCKNIAILTLLIFVQGWVCLPLTNSYMIADGPVVSAYLSDESRIVQIVDLHTCMD